MSDWRKEYDQKLKTPADAVKLVQDGDQVVYSHFAMQTPQLDKALAARKGDLHDVDVHFTTLTYVPEVVAQDMEGESFRFIDGSFSLVTRGIKDADVPMYVIPELYHECPRALVACDNLWRDVLFLATTPMDNNGFFNFGPSSSYVTDLIRAQGGSKKKLKVIVEENSAIPYVYGDNFVHISDVDVVVKEDQPTPITTIDAVEATETDKKIANLIMGEMVDGACIQLGIGGMPNYVGKMLADSDFKDLGCHSEMFVDAYMDLFNAGKLTNKRKQIDIGKSIFTFALGSEKLYEFIDHNPSVNCLTVDYVNNPFVISRNDRVYSICSCIEVDMFGNVSSESVGYKQVSGTGGQWDYHYASMHSQGGKGFVCMPATRTDSKGKLHSNVVVNFKPGTQITIPGNTTNYVVTEYGIANLKITDTCTRVERLLAITHPDFQQDIIDAAEAANIFRRSNRR